MAPSTSCCIAWCSTTWPTRGRCPRASRRPPGCLRPGGALVAIEPGLWHPIGLGLALANRAGVASAVHGTPDDIPLSPRRLIGESRAAGPGPRAPRRHLHVEAAAAGGAAVTTAARCAGIEATSRGVWPYADADRAAIGQMSRPFHPDRSQKGADTLAAVSSVAPAPDRALSHPDDVDPSRRLRWPGTSIDAAVGAVLAAGFLLVAFLTAGGTDLGPNTWVEVAVVLVGAALAAAVTVFGAPGRAWGGVTLLLFAALAALTYASIAWSVQPDNSWTEANRTLSYLAAFGAAIALARIVPERWPALLGAVGAAATVICGYALLVKVFPGSLDANDLVGRLKAPFGYWNATGLAAALGVPACIWAGARPVRGRILRALSIPALVDPARGARALLLARRGDRSDRRLRRVVRVDADAAARRPGARSRRGRSGGSGPLGTRPPSAHPRRHPTGRAHARRPHLRDRGAARAGGDDRRRLCRDVRAGPCSAARAGSPADRHGAAGLRRRSSRSRGSRASRRRHAGCRARSRTCGIRSPTPTPS